MAWITPVTYETASEESKAILDKIGHEKLQSKKLSLLLKNAVVYNCVELNCWPMDDELQRVVGKRLGDLLEYVIAREHKAPFCLRAYTRCMEQHGIDFETTQFTEEEQLIIEFGQAVARDFHNIPKDLKERMSKVFTEEQIAVITGMAVVTTADNMFETIMEMEL